MAFTRIKQEKNGSDVDAARAKLNIALQCVIEKRNESPSSSDNESNKGNAELVVKKEPQPVSLTTKKQTQRTQRKRRRKDDSTIRSSNTYVMKLFDRAVDLSPFTEETPLYPICRAWINNQPHQTSNSVTTQETQEDVLPSNDTASDLEKISEEQATKEVHQLPLPHSYAKEHPQDLRIPSPIPPNEEEFYICSELVDAPSKESLMAKHMERWKTVRQKWKHAAQTNEDRYRDSGSLLKAIFERSQCRDEADGTEQWETVASIT